MKVNIKELSKLTGYKYGTLVYWCRIGKLESEVVSNKKSIIFETLDNVEDVKIFLDGVADEMVDRLTDARKLRNVKPRTYSSNISRRFDQLVIFSRRFNELTVTKSKDGKDVLLNNFIVKYVNKRYLINGIDLFGDFYLRDSKLKKLLYDNKSS